MNEYWILAFVFVSSFVYGLIGFGDAIILIPLATPFIGVQTAIIIVSIWGFLPSLLNLIQYRKFIDKKFMIRGILTGIPGAIIGTLLIFAVDLRWIELIFGSFILTFSIIKIRTIIKSQKKHPDSELVIKAVPESILIFGGFSNGFFGGLIGASGPINVALLEGTGHYRENFIGNFAAIGFPMTLVKVSMYVITDTFPTGDLLVIFFLGLPIIFLASKLGHKITPKISVEKFRLLVLIVMVIIGVRIILVNTIFYS